MKSRGSPTTTESLVIRIDILREFLKLSSPQVSISIDRLVCVDVNQSVLVQIAVVE